MLKHIKNSKIKGTVGLGKAIQYFTSKECIVSLPINDSQKYDLVVDVAGNLQRIQVKTSASTNNDGLSWEIALRTTGGNQSFYTAKLFDPTTCDAVFILTEDGRTWLIPSDRIHNTTKITVGKKWAEYEIQE
jgi:hypothetical protein